MNTKSYHTLSATSLGLTLLLVAALVAIGLGTAPGQMAAARLTLGALACLSGGTWLVLRQREDDLAAGRAFSWTKTTAKIVGWCHRPAEWRHRWSA